MTSLKEQTKKFLSRYGIKLLSDSKRSVRSARVTNFFISAADKDVVYTHPMEFDSEPVITIDIPLSKLEQLAEIESMFFDNIDDVQPRRLFTLWAEQREEEKRLQYRFPAVKKAYEHYSAMLAWCGDGKKSLTDPPPEEE